MTKLESAKQLSKEVLDDIEFFVKDATSMTVWGCVEKQIALKPISLSPSHKSLRCPICKCEVELNEIELNYCNNCGQKILWED